MQIELLDCTLRDGAYIVDARFGTTAIKGIIKKLMDARIDIIECGWLKDKAHEDGTTFYHVPDDALPYLPERTGNALYVAMIDWDRYDTSRLPPCDGKSVQAIRVVFPRGKHREAVHVGSAIRAKGYQVFFQAANTLAYREEELRDMADCINAFSPVALSVVDTFGAMFEDDLDRIVGILHEALRPEIKLGFHSHNNQQLSFALTMRFVRLMQDYGRNAIVDASLCGMGRGAGNATTELVASFLNRKHHGNYDMNAIMDAIDMYMPPFQENYTWGYSTPYFIAGMYQCHVNNIAYLLRNHRTNARDMRNIIASLSPEERRRYDYDLLERKYLENQDRLIDDEHARAMLRKALADREVLLLAPGKSIRTEEGRIRAHIAENHPMIIGVNAIEPRYEYDYLFFVNRVRYDYAREIYPEAFQGTKKIILSNIKTDADAGEWLVNFHHAVKRGWEHFDNAVICALRLLDNLGIRHIALAGFDGFKTAYNESYADPALPTLNPDNKWDELNEEIKDMFGDVLATTRNRMDIRFLTESIFDLRGTHGAYSAEQAGKGTA